MMDINGYTISNWDMATGGETAVAKKGGKIYFIKKYNTVLKPSENCHPKLKAQKEKPFNRFVERRGKINRTISSLANPSLVGVVESFVFENHFIEVSDFVENVMNVMAVARLGWDKKKEAVLSAIRAVALIHSAGLVHSDIKPSNLLMVKNGENIEARLIDFDSSYMEAEKSALKGVGGDLYYAAPETAIGMADEEGIYRDQLGLKADVFSLALTIFEYLTGRKFCRTGEKKAWEFVTSGAEISLKGLLPEPYCSVLEKMLKAKSEDRITAQEAYDMISAKITAIPSEPAKASEVTVAAVVKPVAGGGKISDPADGLPLDQPWKEDNIVFLPDGFRARGFVSAVRKVDSVSGKRYYRVLNERGFSRIMQKEQLLAMGCARAGDGRSEAAASAVPPVATASTKPLLPVTGVPTKKCEVCEPWDGDMIVFDPVTLGAMGCDKIERNSEDRRNYKLTFGKTVSYKDGKKCVEEGYAKEIGVMKTDATVINRVENLLWDGDVGVIDKEVMKAKNILRFFRCEADGRKVYELEIDDGAGGVKACRFDYGSLKMLGIIK